MNTYFCVTADHFFLYSGQLPTYTISQCFYIEDTTEKRVVRDLRLALDAVVDVYHCKVSADLRDYAWLKDNGLLSGIITKQEAEARLLTHGQRLTIISSFKMNAFFFTNDHCYGLRRPDTKPDLPNHWVSRSCDLPMHVTPRPILPNGLISTIEQYISIFHKNEIYISDEFGLDQFLLRGWY